jgi:hypothetical protein
VIDGNQPPDVVTASMDRAICQASAVPGSAKPGAVTPDPVKQGPANEVPL